MRFTTPALAGVALLFGAALASAAPLGRACTCDCDSDGEVTVDELLVSVNLALTGGASCGPADSNLDGQIDVAEVVSCITPALQGCPLVTVADAAFWDTLGLIANREEESLALYEQATAQNPSDARSWFLKGMMHFYRFGKELVDYENFNAAAEREIDLAVAALDAAVLYAPENRAYPGFRGGATFQKGLVHDDAALVELGLQQLRDSIVAWGFFNRFSFLGTVAAAVPRGDPLFDESYQYLLASVGPDGLAECTPSFCGNAGKALSNLSGTALLFGDLFAKAGDLERARGWYRLGGSATYPFADLIRERAQTVAARVAAYEDEDPSNDPPVAGLGAENCVICHARPN